MNGLRSPRLRCSSSNLFSFTSIFFQSIQILLFRFFSSSVAILLLQSMRDATMCQKCMDKIINSVSKKGDSGCLTASNMTKPNPRPAHQVAAATSIPTVSGVLVIGIGSRSARGGYMCSKESSTENHTIWGNFGNCLYYKGK